MLTLSKKILVAIDGSPQSDKAAEEAVRLAAASGQKFKSHIYALLVLPKSDAPAIIDYLPDSRATAVRSVDEIRRRMFYVIEKSAREADVEFENLVAYGEPADEIIHMAKEKECDVIVIGSSGKGRLKRALLGSVSAKVAMQAHLSVYIVR